MRECGAHTSDRCVDTRKEVIRRLRYRRRYRRRWFADDSMHNMKDEWRRDEIKLTVMRGRYTFNDKNLSSSTACAVLTDP
jgi:hypothetical protein